MPYFAVTRHSTSRSGSSQGKSFVMLYVGIGKVKTRPFASPSERTSRKALLMMAISFLEVPVGVAAVLSPDDHGLVAEHRGHGEVHRDVREGGLEADPGGHVDVEHELLQRLLHLVEGEAVRADEGGEEGVEVGEGLRAGRLSLQRVEEVHDLAQRASQVLRGLALDLSRGALEPLHQQILDVPAHAVDGEDAQVVDVKVALGVRRADLGRVDLVQPVDLAHLGGDVVVQSLEGVAHVGVLFDLPVRLVEVAVDQVDVGARDDLADLRVLVPVEDVRLGRLPVLGREQHLLHDVLDLLDRRNLAGEGLLGDGHHAQHELLRRLEAELCRCLARLLDGRGDLARVKGDNCSVALSD